MSDLRERVAAYVDAHMPALREATLVLAASGGADSAAMVSLLCETGIAVPSRAVIAHFDHRLRSDAEADADRAAVRALATRYALPLACGAWDEPQPSEAAARDGRYAFLANVARDRRASLVITGHTRDDQAETVLMRAMRGAGLHGLAGMSPLAPLPVADANDLTIARPLLDVSRAETRAWCADHAIAFHDDTTNEDRGYARNRLRMDVLPTLTLSAPDIAEDLVALAAHARVAADALDAAAAPAVSTHGSIIRIDRAQLMRVPDLASHAARLALVALLGVAREYDRRHYAAMARAIVAGATGATLQLPRGVIATIDPDAVLLSIGPIGVPAIDPGIASPLPFDGDLGAWRLRVVRAPDGIALPDSAIVRRRRDGDRVRLPAGRSAKLQDVFVDRKVPRRLRDATPVIATGGAVWWTPWTHTVAADGGDCYAIEAEIEPAYALGAPPIA